MCQSTVAEQLLLNGRRLIYCKLPQRDLQLPIPHIYFSRIHLRLVKLNRDIPPEQASVISKLFKIIIAIAILLHRKGIWL